MKNIDLTDLLNIQGAGKSWLQPRGYVRPQPKPSKFIKPLPKPGPVTV
jgi:hypothetical protein